MTSLNVSITPAEASDATSVFTMAAELSQSFDVAGQHQVSDFVRIIHDPHYVLLISRNDEKALGYIFGNIHYALYAAGNIAWVEELFVQESVRGRGIGSELLHAFESIAIDSGSRLISVATRRASAFYLRNGYERSAEYFRKGLT